MLNYKAQSSILLIAEDDDDDFYLAKAALEEAKVLNPFFRVKDGLELMSYLKGEGKFSEREKYPYPSLLLLDLNMPKLDGREALHIIKQDDNLKTLPIVVLTTSKSEEDIIKSYELGSNSFIRKPVSFDALVEIVKNLGQYWFEIVELPESN
jgi:CheY-like chemotaxis protein